MSRKSSLAPPVPSVAGLSPVAQSLRKIEQLANEQQSEALKIIWQYDPANEAEFSVAMRAFAMCIGGKAKASRLLITTPVTLYRWMSGTHVPRAFVRAGLKARMIELLGDAGHTAPTGADSDSSTQRAPAALQRRRYG
jgi:hypothetical protein